ncbi:ABC transporter permease [Paenibacillus solisilvae]|uniref:ABC transporter permease n=1 Tax=Paenibacillus solisilvae TaxID=2486751 RepID=A0ABW0W5C6_9BACL
MARVVAVKHETKKAVRSRSSAITTQAGKSLRKHWQLYLLVIPLVVHFIIFKYIPMFNVVLAFKDYNIIKGIWGSPWVGMKYFNMFFHNPVFFTLLKNTLYLSLYSLAAGFPIPIILALALNEVKNARFKRTVQLVTYAPYFISTVVMVSIIMLFLSPNTGIINMLLGVFGIDPINFLGNPNMFRSVYVWSDIWQGAGYAAVIYLAALAGVDPSLYEAAKVDGASRLQKIWNVDLPGILPTTVIILILSVGSIMGVGFEKIYLLQNPLNTVTSEVISTYVYKIGLLNSNYSFATAVGLFNSLVNMILLFIVNAVAKRVSNSNGLW